MLADIKENPAEDRFRLILADWLEDSGRSEDVARAELIRLQVRLRGVFEQDAQSAMIGRAKDLLQQWLPTWLGPMVGLVRWAECRRGLLEVCLAPHTACSQRMRSLAGHEVWLWVETVLFENARRDDLTRLRSNPLFSTVSTLKFTQGAIGSEDLEEVARWPWLGNLRGLDLGHNIILDGTFRLLVESPHLKGLTELALAGCFLSPASAQTLANWPGLQRLERLVLSSNRLGGLGVDALSECSAPALAQLDLRANHISALSQRTIHNLSRWPDLRRLDLSDNHIGPESAQRLAEMPGFANLENLVLWGNPIGTEGVELLRRRFGSVVTVSGAVF